MSITDITPTTTAVEDQHASSSSESEHPEEAAAAGGSSTAQSRGEKKARKALAKMGLKHVRGINRVTFRRHKTQLFVVATPDVYKSPNSETYVVFGEVKVEDMSQANPFGGSMRNAPARRTKQQQAYAQREQDDEEDAPPALVEGEEEGDLDETGLEAKDIELVMSQANCSRARAIKALRENDNDIVNSILNLTL